MADCNETLRELDLFLDAELSSETHGAIRDHLEGCPDCLQTYDFHAELKIVVAQKCRNDEMPPGLMDKIKNCFGEDALSDVDSPDSNNDSNVDSDS